MTRRLLTLGALALAAATARAAAPPLVQIVAPSDGGVVVGLTLLRARIVPPEQAASAAFFVDGRQVCTVRRQPFECDWDAGPIVEPHLVRLVVNLAGGGRIVRTTRTAEVAYAETVDVDVVQVTLTVTDDRGRYVKGLPQSAFRVAENGRPQVIEHFYSDNVPLELVVAVDASASMTPAVPTTKRAVAEFLAAVSPAHRVTLLGFNDAVFTLARRSADVAERRRAVERLSAWGTTALYEAILHAVDLLGSQPGRKALVVFTDGDDQGSHVTIDEIEGALQSSDLMLYMIGQGRGLTIDPLRRVMERLSEPTGGRALTTASIGELRESFAEILEELANQYVLGYQPTNPARDGSWREIAVTVPPPYRVRARQGYRAPGAPQ